ncbi:MAG: serpin family protein [Oscillatoriaceae cyanobacterium Prado104]|jgi:serpin B|nr:serpin family protein [Oscillatoriaceae cyanobacterium Prado104]
MKNNNLSPQNNQPLEREIKQQQRRKLFFLRWPATLGTCLLFVALFLGLKDREKPLKSIPLVKPPTQQVASEDLTTLVKGNTKFALDLYQQIRSQTPDTENIFFSPYSVSSALAMTSAGARGNTAAQMNQVLNFKLLPTTLHPGFAQLNHQLTNARGYQLSIANRLWGQNNFSFQPDFVKLTDDFYGAKFEGLDFFNDAQKATDQINQWVSDRTQNQIYPLLPCGLGKNTKLVLTNALYFKGNWHKRFESTEKQHFNLASGEREKVDLMYQSNGFSYGEDENLQVLEMPYQGDLSMVILLPAKQDGLPDLERKFTTENLEKWSSLYSLPKQEVDVWLPKFKVERAVNLSNTLSQMGMPDAFKGEKADFSGITNQPNLYISEVVHKAFVEVEESGTKAAAATAVIMCQGPCPPMASPAPMRPKLFRADRPFLFLIKDQKSGSILFMGRFVNPKNPSQRIMGRCGDM